MKIAVLFPKELFHELFSESAVEWLEKLGTVNYLTAGDPARDAVPKVLKGAEIAVTSWGSPQLTEELLDLAPALQLVVHAAGSVKGIVSQELYRRKIRVVSSACMLSRGVSEMALGLAIAAAKNVFAYNREIHSGHWPEEKTAATELFDIQVGVVGCGYAGSHFIELLQNFGVQILAYDPALGEEQLSAMGAKKADLETVFRQSDILSLHAPALESTYHMVNKETLGWMKQDAILINTARGSLVDEMALAEAMKSGKLKYACLDVTDPEPPAADNPLFAIENCIFTPHIAGLANNGKKKIGMHVCQEIERYEQGKPLTAEVTEKMLATIA